MVNINPKFIVVDFLRRRISDPRAESSEKIIPSITATAGQTKFDYSPSSGKVVLTVLSVEINSSEKKKWRDYYIDFRNRQVVSFTELDEGDTVDITILEADRNFIFWDKTEKSLSNEKWPRISVSVLESPGVRSGNYEAPMQNSIRMKIISYTKEGKDDQIFTISDRKYAGQELAEYLGYQVQDSFTFYENDLYPALYNFTLASGPSDAPFNDELQAYECPVNIILNALNVGNL